MNNFDTVIGGNATLQQKHRGLSASLQLMESCCILNYLPINLLKATTTSSNGKQYRLRLWKFSLQNALPALYIVSILILLHINDTVLHSRLLNIDTAIAFTVTPSRSFGYKASTFTTPIHNLSPKRTFHHMVVSDPTESKADNAILTKSLPDMPLQPGEDGIYALTTPEEHTALMQYAEQHQQLVILKVFAPWCRACKGLESKFVQISREADYAPSSSIPIIYASLSIQHNKAFVQSLGVLALPTIQFYVAGQLIDNFPCGPSKVPILRRKLSQLINDHVDLSTGKLKEGSMEQVAVLAEETAASIAAAAAAKRQSSTSNGETATNDDGDVEAQTRAFGSPSKDNDPSPSPVIFTSQERTVFEGIPFFKGLSIADFDDLLSKVVPLTFQPGSIIVREGKPGRTFYVIKEGEVEICQKTTNQRPIVVPTTYDPLVQPSIPSVSTNNNLYIGAVVNRLGPGDFFGERALITGEPRAASLRVAESGPVTVWAFDKDIFPFSNVLSGKSRNTGALSSKSNTQFMDQVNTKYGVGLNNTDTSVLDDTDEANLQQIIDEYQQAVLTKQLYEASTASQSRGSIHNPQPLPDSDVDVANLIQSSKGLERIRPTTLPVSTETEKESSHDAIFSLLSRFQMIRHVSRCFRYIQESKTMLKWGDSGTRTRRNMLVQRLSQPRQMEYQEIFHFLDRNKDGCIEVRELQDVLESIGEPITVNESLLKASSDCSDSPTALDAEACVNQGGMTYDDFMGLMAEAEFYYLFRDIFASLDVEDSGYVKARDLDRVLCGVRDLISDDRKSVIDVEDKDMLIDYEQFSRMLLGTTLL